MSDFSMSAQGAINCIYLSVFLYVLAGAVGRHELMSSTHNVSP